MTIQGNVAVYGDADLMPPDDDDERPAARPEPEPAPAVKRRRGGWLRRLRFAALPLLPVAIIMAVTPWGRGLVHDGKTRVESLFGAGPAPSGSVAASGPPGNPSTGPAPSAGAGSAVVLVQPPSGRAGAAVKLTASGFGPGERIDVKTSTKTLTTLTADDQGAVEESVTVAPAGTKTGSTVIVQLVGRTSHRSATSQYRVTQ
ncbi:hypothetical protein AB0M46_07930 [Dactylosporangium sp. NPDC051485]|uniref:hypothetical protein n=1 Tax=Dactylosporangium sp. NPDC051485 TaxID=3154846 RepID=UPI003417EB26